MKIKQLQWNKLNRAYMVHDSVCYWVREKKTGWAVQVSTRNGARVDDLPAQTTEDEAKLMAQKHFESLVAIEEPAPVSRFKKVPDSVVLEYFNGSEWVYAGGPFGNEAMAWASLGGDDVNYRTIEGRTIDGNGKILTSKQEIKKK